MIVLYYSQRESHPFSKQVTSISNLINVSFVVLFTVDKIGQFLLSYDPKLMNRIPRMVVEEWQSVAMVSDRRLCFYQKCLRTTAIVVFRFFNALIVVEVFFL